VWSKARRQESRKARRETDLEDATWAVEEEEDDDDELLESSSDEPSSLDELELEEDELDADDDDDELSFLDGSLEFLDLVISVSRGCFGSSVGSSDELDDDDDDELYDEDFLFFAFFWPFICFLGPD